MPKQLKAGQAQLLVIDLQVKLLPIIDERERVIRRSAVLIEAAKILGLPIVWTEQYRKGLGETAPEVAEAIGAMARPMEKLAFGCLGDEAITQAVAASGRRQLIVCGIETHVCVLQTVLKALGEGYEVFLAEDALGSRRASDRETAIRRMTQAGAIPATVEMLIMEALGCAGSEKFKAILPLLKDL